MAFKHESFWRPMDTLKDKQVLEDLFEQGIMPWRLDTSPSPAGIAVPRAVCELVRAEITEAEGDQN
jgi:glucose-1-phosphate cytidylyltransferase